MSTFDRLLPELSLCLIFLYAGSVYFTRDMNITTPGKIIANKAAQRAGNNNEETKKTPVLKIKKGPNGLEYYFCEQIFTMPELKLQLELALMNSPKREVIIDPEGNIYHSQATTTLLQFLTNCRVRAISPKKQ